MCWKAYRVMWKPSAFTYWIDLWTVSVRPSETVFQAYAREREAPILSGDLAFSPLIDCDDRSYLLLGEH